LEEIVKRSAERIFVPLTVGGGIRSVDDANNLLKAGADKIAVNTAAIQRPALIAELVEAFGSQCVTVSIQAKHRGGAAYECLTDNARETTGQSVFDWAQKVVTLGAGEILLTSVDREGTGKGYELELIRRVTQSVPVPAAQLRCR